ncbi:MAG: hypothetical protein ACFE9N_04455 [Promethearchaeota archaeon]
MKKSISNEVIGKYFFLNKIESSFIQGWIPITGSLKQFIRDIKEEIEYELDSENIIIENYLMFYIDINENKLTEIKDDKILNNIKRNKKIFLVLLDKKTNFSKMEDIPHLNKWYLDGLKKYEY